MGADCGAIDAVMAAIRHDLGQNHSDGLPDPGFAPSAEPAINGVPTAVFGRYVSPRRSAPEPPEYAVDDGTVVNGTSASTTVLRLDWQQALQDSPFCFGEIASAQNCLQKAALNQGFPRASIQHDSKSAFVVVSAWNCGSRLISFKGGTGTSPSRVPPTSSTLEA